MMKVNCSEVKTQMMKKKFRPYLFEEPRKNLG